MHLLGVTALHEPRAVPVAELVLWIGWLQWHFRTRGNIPPAEPILRDFHNIRQADALRDLRVIPGLKGSQRREGSAMASFGSELLAAALAGTLPGEHPLRHTAELPPRSGRPQRWPEWAEPAVVRAFTARGISMPWSHQSEAAELAHAGRHVVVSTGTASGSTVSRA